MVGDQLFPSLQCLMCITKLGYKEPRIHSTSPGMNTKKKGSHVFPTEQPHTGFPMAKLHPCCWTCTRSSMVGMFSRFQPKPPSGSPDLSHTSPCSAALLMLFFSPTSAWKFSYFDPLWRFFFWDKFLSDRTYYSLILFHFSFWARSQGPRADRKEGGG